MSSSLNQWSWKIRVRLVPLFLWRFQYHQGKQRVKMGSLKPGQFKKGTCWFNPLELEIAYSHTKHQNSMFFKCPRGHFIRGVPRFLCWTMCRNAIYLGWQFPWNMAVKSARDASTFVVGNRCPTGGCVDPRSPQIKMIFSLQDGAIQL